MANNISFTRRHFLQTSALSLGLPILPSLAGISNVAIAQSAEQTQLKKISGMPLIVVFQRGGADGLGIVSPLDDIQFQAARPPDMRFSKAASIEKAAPIVLDGIPFYWHPDASALANLYQDKALLAWQGVGLLDETRSHFEAQEIIERGVSQLQRLPDQLGWMTRQSIAQTSGLARLSKNTAEQNVITSIPLFSGNDNLPRSLLGSTSAMAARDLQSGIQMPGGPAAMKAIEALFSADQAHPTAHQMQSVLHSINLINGALPKAPDNPNNIIPYQTAGSTPYPNSDPGMGLRSIARLLESKVGLQYAWVDQGGWDTHENQSWRLSYLLKDLGNALLAFSQDMQARNQPYVLLVLSEFGRRLRTNRSGGSDHGHASLAFVMGSSVSGGQMLGSFAGLATHQLDRGVDLAVTTDYLKVLDYALKKTNV